MALALNFGDLKAFFARQPKPILFIQDIVEFLEERCGEDAVTICMGRDGRPSGEALVGFHQEADWTFCQLKHKQNLGKRYVEVYDWYV